MPGDPYGLIPQGLWADEYRQAGGISVQDMLGQQQQQQAYRQQAYQDSLAAYEAQQQQAQQQAQQEAYAKAQQEFVDWPTYQQIVSDNVSNPRDAWQEYIAAALPSQLEQMGYSPEEAQQEIAQFMKLVPQPAPDYGFFGNLYESGSQGFGSAGQAERATGNLVGGDLDALARLVAEQSSGDGTVAPLQAFNKLANTDAAKGDFWEAVKAWAGAAYDQPQGALNFLVQQFT